MNLPRWKTLPIALALWGCAAAPERSDVTFDRAEFARVLAFAYDTVAERFIDGIAPERLALDGLQGLADVDPALKAGRRGDVLRIESGDISLSWLSAPQAADANAWAQAMARLVGEARLNSPQLAALDSERLLKLMLDAALARIDPFSRYASAEDAREQRANRNGFGGIGIRFKTGEAGAEIVDILPGSPADKARIKIADTITALDGAEVTGLSQADISKRLRGAVDTPLLLSLKRAEKDSFDVALRRELIVPPSVTLTLDQDIALLKVSTFNQRTAASIAERLFEARERTPAGLRGVILDFRGNPGGLLDQAVATADLFLGRGRIVATKGRHPHANQRYEADPDDFAEGLPLVILMDGRSASAAEIVAAALQDQGRAIVVGTVSYGKGTVQTVIRLPNDGEIALTWSRFLTPSGYALQGLGVLPNLCTADATDESVLERLKSGRLTVAHDLADWRAAPFDDRSERQRLRALCPDDSQVASQAEPAKSANPWDETIAMRLIKDRGLHARAGALTAPLEAGR